MFFRRVCRKRKVWLTVWLSQSRKNFDFSVQHFLRTRHFHFLRTRHFWLKLGSLKITVPIPIKMLCFNGLLCLYYNAFKLLLKRHMVKHLKNSNRVKTNHLSFQVVYIISFIQRLFIRYSSGRVSYISL